MLNYDKIRNMSVDELVKFLDNYFVVKLEYEEKFCNLCWKENNCCPYSDGLKCKLSNKNMINKILKSNTL